MKYLLYQKDELDAPTQIDITQLHNLLSDPDASDFVIIIIGNNAQENFTAIDLAKKIAPDALWFHLRDYSSCHVILFGRGDIDMKPYISEAAYLTKQNTKYKNVPNTVVEWTLLKHINKSKPIGTVQLTKKPKYITV